MNISPVSSWRAARRSRRRSKALRARACPSGVEIPLNFAVYNLYRSLWAESAAMATMVFANHYRSVPASERADQCVACGECEVHCPQRIAIPSLMSDIADLAVQAAS